MGILILKLIAVVIFLTVGAAIWTALVTFLVHVLRNANSVGFAVFSGALTFFVLNFAFGIAGSAGLNLVFELEPQTLALIRIIIFAVSATIGLAVSTWVLYKDRYYPKINHLNTSE